MSNTPSELLRIWVFRQLSEAPGNWLNGHLETLLTAPSRQAFDIAFGMIPRKLGKEDLVLSDEDLADADAARAGWNPRLWSLDQAARVMLLVNLSNDASENFAARFKDLHGIADVSELLALYSGLPLYANPEALVEFAALGLRTNIKAEFEAISHKNPFPAEQFTENPWNNMVRSTTPMKINFELFQLSEFFFYTDKNLIKKLTTLLDNQIIERMF